MKIIRAISKNKKTEQIRLYFFDGTILSISYNVAVWGYYCNVNDSNFDAAALEGALINGNENLVNWVEIDPIVQNMIVGLLENEK